MPKARKMVSLNIEEASGVDHPAHLQEGWLVIKSTDSDVSDLLSDLVKNENTSSDHLNLDGTEEEPMPQDDTDVVDKAKMPEEVKDMFGDDDKKKKMSYDDMKKKIAELEDELDKAKKKLEKVKDEEADDKKMKKSDDIEDVIKSAPEAVQAVIAEMRKSADEATARAKAAEEVLLKEREDRADAESVVKAKAWGHLPIEAEKIGPALRRLAGIDSDLAKSVEEMLNAVEAQAESANIFAEIGKSATPANGSAYEQLTSMAKAVAETSGVTFEQAFADAVSKNTDLYSQYLSEKGVK